MFSIHIILDLPRIPQDAGSWQIKVYGPGFPSKNEMSSRWSLESWVRG